MNKTTPVRDREPSRSSPQAAAPAVAHKTVDVHSAGTWVAILAVSTSCAGRDGYAPGMGVSVILRRAAQAAKLQPFGRVAPGMLRKVRGSHNNM
eukprot:CAMPEP_0195082700 /NCGR_PEP_ID=MMETSP0448-20130528/23826_1 /TAXON_ID=66468 /ORGANISM="Heterocapsa triquestra, Strain CCMP 448" /LENGTH=93 /DNA_ID=CAMNT_0040115831 /DNA_START=8 /DNA_END=287 /DNA_ORIENTATION=-